MLHFYNSVQCAAYAHRDDNDIHTVSKHMCVWIGTWNIYMTLNLKDTFFFSIHFMHDGALKKKKIKI